MRAAGLGLAVALWVVPAEGVAQGRGPADPVSADHDRAGSLQQQGRHAEAAVVYWALYGRTRLARDLALAGFAEAAAGRWVQAELALGRALAAADDPWVVENRPLLIAQHALCRSRVGRLVLEGGVAGAAVSVEGTSQAVTLPLAEPLRVPVGLTRVSVQAPGYRTFSRRVMVQPEGEAPTRLLVTLAPVGAPTTPDDEDEDRPRPEAAPRPRPSEQTVAEAPANPPVPLRQEVGYVSLGVAFAGLSTTVGGLVLHHWDVEAGQPMLFLGLTVMGVFGTVGSILLLPSSQRPPRTPLGAPRASLGCSPSLGAPGLACAVRW